MTITGANFESGATVTFGASAAASVTFVSANSLQVTTPPSPAGTVPVTVTNPDGQSGSLQSAFQYVVPVAMNPGIQAQLLSCQLKGTVTGVSPPTAFKVVIYAYTNMYYIQPCDTEPLQPIATDGSWGPIDSHSGTMYALLVVASYNPATILTSLPPVDGINVLAETGPIGVLSGCDVARCPAQ